MICLPQADAFHSVDEFENMTADKFQSMDYMAQFMYTNYLAYREYHYRILSEKTRMPFDETKSVLYTLRIVDPPKPIKIVVLEKNGRIRKFNCLKEAANFLNVHYNKIGNAIKNNKTVLGYTASYVYEVI